MADDKTGTIKAIAPDMGKVHGGWIGKPGTTKIVKGPPPPPPPPRKG